MIWIALAHAVPMELTHQGRMLDSTGVPYLGSHNVKVSLFSGPVGGAAIWEEEQPVEFDQGYYRVLLGADTVNNALPGSAFELDDLWIDVTIDGGAPLDQRQPVSAVPWAIRADSAENVTGGVVDASEIRVNGSTVIDSSGSLAVDDTLSSLACSTGQIATFNGTDWACATPATGGGVLLWSDIVGVPLDFTDNIDNDELAGLSCGDDQTIRYDAIGSRWICSDRYADADATLAMGTKDDANPLHHDRYTDTEAVNAVGPHFDVGDAVAAMGAQADSNPLNHARYSDADAILAVGPHYTDADAIAAVGPHYTDAQAVSAVGPHYTDTDAINAVGPHYDDAAAIAAVGPHYDDAAAIAAVGPHYDDAAAIAAVGPHYDDADAIAAVGPHYTDGAAVGAVATADAYVRNTGDTLTGGLTVDRLTSTEPTLSPLVVASSAQVANLNADQVDGLDAVEITGQHWQVRATGGQTYCSGAYRDINGLTMTVDTNGGDLRITGNVSVYYGSHSALRATIDGQYAGEFSGNSWTYVWQDGLQCTSCPGCGNWTNLFYDKMFTDIPAGTHTIRLQIYTDGACASCGVVIGNGSIQGSLEVEEYAP